MSDPAKPGDRGLMGPARPARLVALDAYRGLIMLTLLSAGLGLYSVAQQFPDDPSWQRVAFHTNHPEWLSAFYVSIGGIELPIGVSYWDLIMPAFVLMVGVSMPYSYGRRLAEGRSSWTNLGHALIRSLVLVMLGVMLQSRTSPQANWIFINVLSQIGLGYTVAYLYLGKGRLWQVLGCAVLLVGVTAWYWIYPAPAGSPMGHWTKDANVGTFIDAWFLALFPSHKPSTGGYTTINFVPTIVTMLLGVMCGELLRSERRPWGKLTMLVLGGLTCMVLGVLAGLLTWDGQPVCPIVKRLWTPSWTLFSGAYAIWVLAAFYLVCDVVGLKRWTFPLVVVGTNSIVAYLMDAALYGWTQQMLRKFLGEDAFAGTYGPIVLATTVMLVFWLVLYWLYRQRVFIRI